MRYRCLLPLCLSLLYRADGHVAARVQDQAPFHSQDMRIRVSDSVTLAGTLTTPLGDSARQLVILVSPPRDYDRDMSAEDRDDYQNGRPVLQHHMFLTLVPADVLVCALDETIQRHKAKYR